EVEESIDPLIFVVEPPPLGGNQVIQLVRVLHRAAQAQHVRLLGLLAEIALEVGAPLIDERFMLGSRLSSVHEMATRSSPYGWAPAPVGRKTGGRVAAQAVTRVFTRGFPSRPPRRPEGMSPAWQAGARSPER